MFTEYQEILISIYNLYWELILMSMEIDKGMKEILFVFSKDEENKLLKDTQDLVWLGEEAYPILNNMY